MGDEVVDEDNWKKLHKELRDSFDDVGKIDAFMCKHVNKKWDV
jgi:hypothetical protein